MTSTEDRLRAVKILHTLVWVFFACCVFAIPIFAWARMYAQATVCIGIVFIEVVVLLFNNWRCPLTGIAARYTADRRDNFDIYLPKWIARYNKELFGVIYAAGILLTVVRWFGW